MVKTTNHPCEKTWTVKITDAVHAKISSLGNCGMSKNDVIESLLNFYEKSDNKRKETKEITA
jgi:hypothetical protein